MIGATLSVAISTPPYHRANKPVDKQHGRAAAPLQLPGMGQRPLFAAPFVWWGLWKMQLVKTETELLPQFDDQQHQRHVLNVIREVLDSHDLVIARRMGTKEAGVIPLKELKDIVHCVEEGLLHPGSKRYLAPVDVRYLNYRKSLYQTALREATTLREEDLLAELKEAEEANDAPREEARIRKQLQQIENIPSLVREIAKPYQDIARSLREESHAYIAKHKKHLELFAEVFAQELRLTPEECSLLSRYVKIHDWSKFLMPLCWTSPAPDHLLGFSPAFSQQGRESGTLQNFFDLVVVHELLEGSSKFGHHLKARSHVKDASGQNMLELLDNDGPCDKVRWIERIMDSMEASITKRIIDSKHHCSDEDPLLSFWFAVNAPGCPTGLHENDFALCIALLFNDDSVRTLEDCHRVAWRRREGGEIRIISTSEFERKSSIYRECRAIVLEAK